MIECRSCGHQNDDQAQFCEQCHSFLEWQGTKRTEKPQSAVTVTLESRSLQVVPGASAEGRARIRNDGGIVDEFRIEVIGGAAAWASVDPPVLRLFPHSGEVIRITFRPPRAPSVTAGSTRYGVKVTSTVSPDSYTVENDLIDVGSYEDWTADLTPKASRGEATATAEVKVQNRGNVPLQVAISATSADDALAVEGAPASLTVAPGETGAAPLTLRPRQPAPPERERTFAYQAVVESLEGRKVTLDGTMLQQGRAIRVEWYARLVPPSWRSEVPVEHKVQVLNRGEAPVTIGLQAQDPSGALQFQIAPSTVTAAPGTEAEAVLTVTPVEELRRGRERQIPFRVIAQGPSSEQTVMDGSLVQLRPKERGGFGWLRWALVVLLVGGLVGAGAWFIATHPIAAGGGGGGGGAGGGGGGEKPPIKVAILDEIGGSRCETTETVQVSIDGQDRGTLRVDNKGRIDDALSLTTTAGTHDFSLRATGTFNVQGRTFTLQDGGSGRVDFADGESFAVEVDEKVLPAGRCPAPGGRWPLLLRKQ